MTLVVLFILAVVWAVYLVSWFRSRRDHRGVNSISSFSKHLSVLERTSPARPGSFPGRGPSGRPAPIYPAVGYQAPRAMSLSDARRRRRNVLYALAGAAVGTLLLSAFLGSTFLALHLLLDVALAAYVVMLVSTQRRAVERRAKVRYLHPVDDGMDLEPQYLLQTSAN